MADDPQHEAAIRLIDDTIEAVGQEVCGVSWVPTAETPRAILAALIQAGWTPPGPVAWEWGVQRTVGGRPGPSWRDTARCADAAHAQRAAVGGGLTVVRRRPAGPWEPAPAPADPTSEEPQP